MHVAEKGATSELTSCSGADEFWLHSPKSSCNQVEAQKASLLKQEQGADPDSRAR